MLKKVLITSFLSIILILGLYLVALQSKIFWLYMYKKDYAFFDPMSYSKQLSNIKECISPHIDKNNFKELSIDQLEEKLTFKIIDECIELAHQGINHYAEYYSLNKKNIDYLGKTYSFSNMYALEIIISDHPDYLFLKRFPSFEKKLLQNHATAPSQ